MEFDVNREKKQLLVLFQSSGAFADQLRVNPVKYVGM